MKPREEQVSKYFQSHYTWGGGRDGLDKGFWEWSTGWVASGRAHVNTKGVWEYEAILPENAIQQKDGWRLRFVSLHNKRYLVLAYILFWVQKEEKFVLLQKQQYSRSALSQHCLSITCNVSSTLL